MSIGLGSNGKAEVEAKKVLVLPASLLTLIAWGIFTVRYPEPYQSSITLKALE